MDKNTKNGTCCGTHRLEILGVIMLAIAAVLTLYTLSGAGIFGMFLVGLVFCTHKYFGCRCCCGSNGGSCSTDTSSCDMNMSELSHHTTAPKKAPSTRKKTKKTV